MVELTPYSMFQKYMLRIKVPIFLEFFLVFGWKYLEFGLTARVLDICPGWINMDSKWKNQTQTPILFLRKHICYVWVTGLTCNLFYITVSYVIYICFQSIISNETKNEKSFFFSGRLATEKHPNLYILYTIHFPLLKMHIHLTPTTHTHILFYI